MERLSQQMLVQYAAPPQTMFGKVPTKTRTSSLSKMYVLGVYKTANTFFSLATPESSVLSCSSSNPGPLGYVGPSGLLPISGWSCLGDLRRYDCPLPKFRPSVRVGSSSPPPISGRPCRGFHGEDTMGRYCGGRERGRGSCRGGCGLPAVSTRRQPNGRYCLAPKTNPSHGRQSPWTTLSLPVRANANVRGRDSRIFPPIMIVPAIARLHRRSLTTAAPPTAPAVPVTGRSCPRPGHPRPCPCP